MVLNFCISFFCICILDSKGWVPQLNGISQGWPFSSKYSSNFLGAFKLSENISRYFTNILLSSNYFRPVQPKDHDDDFPCIEPRSTFPIFLMPVLFVFPWYWTWHFPVFFLGIELGISLLFPWNWINLPHFPVVSLFVCFKRPDHHLNCNSLSLYRLSDREYRIL